jgi:hypothetical protein
MDTALPSPLDVVGLDEGPQVVPQALYPVAPYAMLVLISEG